VRHSPQATIGGVTAVVLAVTTVAAQSTSVWSGVYTTEQATAGERLYFEKCSSCHGDDLAGRERAPALAGTQFVEAWHGKNLRRLLERIEEMPPGAPVPPAEAVDLLAFLLSASEMPSGATALPTDRARLAEIAFERAKP
jgi:mono/diheme cytochrome c family protein